MVGPWGKDPEKSARAPGRAEDVPHPPANNHDPTVWATPRSDLKLGSEAPGRRVPVASARPASGGEQVPSSHPGRVEGACPAAF